MCPLRSAEALRGHVNVPVMCKGLCIHVTVLYMCRQRVQHRSTGMEPEHYRYAFCTCSGTLLFVQEHVPVLYMTQCYHLLTHTICFICIKTTQEGQSFHKH